MMSTLLFSFGFLTVAPATTLADTGDIPMRGWAWSDNTGWISFDSVSSGSPISYGVVKKADGTIQGFAWSDSLGWIQFGNLTGFPSSPGTEQVNASVDSSGVLHGWARACTGSASGTCVVTGNGPDNVGDWDGWISLGSTNPAFGSHVNADATISGWAWGGMGVGWLLFGPLSLCSDASCNTQTIHINMGVNQGSSAQIGAPSAITVQQGPNSSSSDTYTVGWVVSGLNGTSSCVPLNDLSTVAPNPQANGSVTLNSYDVSPGTHQYTLFCKDTQAQTNSDRRSVSVDVEPPVNPTLGGCNASPAVAGVSQDVTWTATGLTHGVAPYTYAWTFTPAAANTQNGTTDTVKVQYATIGIKNASVIVTDAHGNSSTPQTCSNTVQIGVNPNFHEF